MGGDTHKKYILSILCVFLCIPFFAFAGESISLYEVDIDIKEDSSIKILETITYDFGENSRRGIFREIPVKYETPYGTRGVDLEIKSISRDGFPEEYTDKKSGRNRVIRIGNPDVYIEGEHVYRITYEVVGAFNAFEDFDELYWNAIGTGWAVPISRALITVDAPSAIVKGYCYEGFFGSNVPCSESVISADVLVGKTTELNPGSGMTVAVAIPKGAVTLPSVGEIAFNWLKNNLILLLPIFVFFFMYRIWEAHGKDAKGRGTIVAQYVPPAGLTPLFLGSIVDGRLSNEDIVAGILYLAEQGYITIEREEKKRFLGSNVDYKLTWTGDFDELNKKEQLLAEIVFTIYVTEGKVVSLSSLKTDRQLHSRKNALVKHIDEELHAQGYFGNVPQKTSNKWLAVGIFVTAFLSFSLASVNLTAAIAIAVSGVIVIIFGVLMPKLTKKGALAREHILGFKKFLSVAEKDRLEFHNAPERTQNEFMEFLPFATALGVESKWAEQFKDLEMENPDWYKGGAPGNFSAGSFSKDISGFGSSMSAGVTAASGGSGSGGGGGGGSW